MDSPYLLLYLGLAYLALVGIIALLRREGLSIRFALEGLAVIALAGVFTFLTGYKVHPAAFLLVLALVTLRARLLVSAGDLLMERGFVAGARWLYRLAGWLAPDPACRTNIDLGLGRACLQRGLLDDAQSFFQAVLLKSGSDCLSAATEAACHYHLGLTYQRRGELQRAIREFKTVIDHWPVTAAARQAAVALNQQARQMLELHR